MLNGLRWEVAVLFCWHWWNCWLSLFELSFHYTKRKFIFIMDFFLLDEMIKTYNSSCVHFIIKLLRSRYIKVIILSCIVLSIQNKSHYLIIIASHPSEHMTRKSRLRKIEKEYIDFESPGGNQELCA
jgi:hypothetical protein